MRCSLFQHEPLQAFEASMTFLTNFCSDWFEYFPHPPISLLAAVEHLLQQNDPQLHRCALQAAPQAARAVLAQPGTGQVDR